MDTNSIQNSAGDSLMKNKRRRKKANKTDELLNMNQMDDALEVPHIGKICTAAVNDLQNNLMELGSQSQAEQSQIVTKPIELHAGQTVLRKKKKREQKKMEAKIEGEHQSVDQMDDHLEVPAIGKLCNDVQNKLIVLDSTAQWHVEQSKMDRRSTENITEGTVLSKNKKKKQKKKKAKNEAELRSVDQMDDHYIGKICTGTNSDLQNNFVELDSTALLHVEQSKMNSGSSENISEGTVQRKKRKRKQKKEKAKNEGELQSVDPMDDQLEVPAIGKLCIVADNDLQNNLIDLDSTAQWHVERSKMDTRSTENITEGTVQRKKKEKKQKKKKDKNEGELQSVDHMDNHLEAPAIGKLCIVANNDLQNNLIELDSSEQWHVEQSKMDTRSTENITKGTAQRKRREKKQKKKKAKNESELQSVNQMDDRLEAPADNDLQNNLIELDSSAQWHVKQSKMDTRSTENITEGTTQRKKKKKKQKKNEAKNESELESVDQMDDHLEVPSIGKLCIVTNNDLQNNLIELDSTAKWHVEQSKMDTRSTENTTEGTVQRKRRKQKKAKNEGELHRVNQMDDHLEAPALGKPFIVANDDLQNNLVELDSTAQFNTKEAKMGTRSTKNLSEGIAQRKRSWRKQNEMRANTKDERQSVGIMSNLNLPDVTHGVGNGTKVITNESTTSLLHLVHDTMKPVGLNKNKASLAPVDIDSKSYSEFLELRSAPMERPREMEVEMFSCKSRHIPLPHEMSSKNEKIENEFKKEENIVHQGKDSAACSSCDVAVTKHLSSPILKEDHLSNDSFLGIAPVASVRRKLLVLDVNGLLADIVMPAPKDSVADTRLLGRAVFRRPFCNDFLKFCFENFDVAIWSSRSKKVIDIVVDYLLGDLRQKLLFCWVIFSTIIKIKGSTSKTIYFSCLNIVFQVLNEALVYNEDGNMQLNIAVLNLAEFFVNSFALSFLFYIEFLHSICPGGNLRVYLEDMLKCDNVKRYVEQHPFGQGAIDERNIYWSFYSRVLESVSAKSF
ncbi:Hypothetical predicted protein [Olea europaea subsp. europaea]|uniref:FCP1 homology domain-containing protein n=1 Tax=Olea europaea subsp. europaea TaxID=158383 RepID=A0A8S0RMH5_OLEEU|nr:Hypothetical predicted protein [Olea europaea subsp. europaea]